MTAHQAKAISNEVKEKNTKEALMEIVKASDLKIEAAAEVGLTETVVEIQVCSIDEDGLREAVYGYFEDLGYKITSYSTYTYMLARYCQITISWEGS